jgi:hypothetical protein
MKPWWLGICPGHNQHPHGSKFSFVIGRGRIESGESHLVLRDLERIIHDLVVGHYGSACQDPIPQPQQFPIVTPANHRRHELEHQIDYLPKTSQHLQHPIVTAPENFLRSSRHHGCYDQPRQIMCIMMYDIMQDGSSCQRCQSSM